MYEWGSSDLLVLTARTSAICSILGSGGCIFLFFYFKWWTESNHHIILFHLSCSDILYSIFVLVGKSSYNIQPLCDFQGWILQFCGQVSQMWCTVVGINLLVQMVLYWSDSRCRTMMRWYILVIYGTGVTTASAVTFRGLVKPTGTWCWVGSNWPVDRMAFFYAPLWLLFTANIFIVGWIIRAFRKSVREIPKDLKNRAAIVKHYRWVTFHTSMFVIVGMVIWLPGTIYRIWQILEQSPPYTLIFLQKVLTPSQGMLNFLLYVTPLWSKSVTESRMSREQDNEIQMSDLKAEEKLKFKTPGLGKYRSSAPSPILFEESIDSDDCSFRSDEIVIPTSAGGFQLPRSQSLPGSFSRGPTETPRTRKSSSLRISNSDHEGLVPLRTKTGRLQKLRKSFNYHNYSLVNFDGQLLPRWVGDAQIAKKRYALL